MREQHVQNADCNSRILQGDILPQEGYGIRQKGIRLHVQFDEFADRRVGADMHIGMQKFVVGVVVQVERSARGEKVQAMFL